MCGVDSQSFERSANRFALRGRPWNSTWAKSCPAKWAAGWLMERPDDDKSGGDFRAGTLRGNVKLVPRYGGGTIVYAEWIDVRRGGDKRRRRRHVSSIRTNLFGSRANSAPT